MNMSLLIAVLIAAIIKNRSTFFAVATEQSTVLCAAKYLRISKKTLEE